MSEQLALFEEECPEPEGLRYAADFVSPTMKLILAIRTLPLQPFQYGEFEGKRRVASFGFRYDYDLRKLQPNRFRPGWRKSFGNVETYGGPATRIQQVLCTEYGVGVDIGWHRDMPDRIFGLSLGSACKFRFRKRTRQDMGSLHARCRTAVTVYDVPCLATDMGTQHSCR